MKLRPAELSELGQRVRSCRHERGMTQEELATRSKLQRAYLGKIEQGQCNVTFLSLCQLAQALESDLGKLLEKLPFPETEGEDLSMAGTEPAHGRPDGNRWKIQPEAIRHYRKRHGLTQRALGERCGVSASAISQWESGGELAGSSATTMAALLAGDLSIRALSPNEERLLDEGVRRGGFEGREDYLAASLLKVVRDDRPAPDDEPMASG